MVCSQQKAVIDALKAENPGQNNVHIRFLCNYRRENLDEWATFKALWIENNPMESESPAEIRRLRALAMPYSLEFLWKDWQECLDETGEYDSTMREKWSGFKMHLEDVWREEQTEHASQTAHYARMPEDPHEIPQNNESGSESDPEWL